MAKPMTAPISVRLDDDVRTTLEAEARSRGIGLATLLRQLAAEAAREVRRKRIRDAKRGRGTLRRRQSSGAATSTSSGARRTTDPG